MMFILQMNPDYSADWLEINEAGAVIATQSIASLAQIPKRNLDDSLIVLIPGEAVVVTSLVLPKTRASERQKVAAFALEEQLATDPESVYLAFGNTVQNVTPVAVMDQARFDSDYATWMQAGLMPRVVTPDFLGIVWEPESWTVVFHRGMALVRTGLHAGFTIDANNLVFFLTHFLNNPLIEKPKKIVVWQEDHIVSLHELAHDEILIETRDAAFKNKWDAKGLLSQLNLLQGKYRPKVKTSALEGRWKTCGIAALAWIGFVFVSQFVQWAYLHHQATDLNGKILTVYQQLFPGASTVLEPHFRASALLKRYEQASQGSVFLKLYRSAGQALNRYPGVTAQSFVFEKAAITFVVSAKNVALITQWSDTLRTKNRTVTQTVTKTDATATQATVVLAEKND